MHCKHKASGISGKMLICDSVILFRYYANGYQIVELPKSELDEFEEL